MKRLYKYVSALFLTGILLVSLNNKAAAQHRGGGGGGSHGGGGGFHGGGGGSRGGGGGFHGGSGFHGGGNSFHGNAGVRPGGNYRGNAQSYNRGNRFNNGRAYNGGRPYVGGGRGYSGGRPYVGGRYGNGYYRGGRYGRGYGGHYYGGRYYGGRYYGGGFRFGFGFGYPHIGFYLGALPYGYYPFYYGDYQYYYSGGTFYRPYNGGYQVVTPPVGASVLSLPGNAQSIVIDGASYFEANGVYYQEGQDDSGKTIYTVVGRDGVLNTDNGANDQPRTDADDPIMDNNNNTSANGQYDNNNRADNATTTVDIREGDIIKDLPADCRKVTLNDKKYYVSPDNIFYEDFKDTDGTKAYRVASVPKD